MVSYGDTFKGKMRLMRRQIRYFNFSQCEGHALLSALQKSFKLQWWAHIQTTSTDSKKAQMKFFVGFAAKTESF